MCPSVVRLEKITRLCHEGIVRILACGVILAAKHVVAELQVMEPSIR